jgi:capsular polysaccharide biosynthesis protein
MNNQQIEAEVEINLSEYINVIIKRKKVFLSVFFVSVIVTAVVSFLMPKTYEVSMIIEPPILSVTNTGVQNLDSVENIKAKIEEGAFNTKIIKELNIKEKLLKFKIKQPNNTRLIKVSVDEKENKTDLGIVILKKLLDGLDLNYAKFIEDKKNEIDNQIAMVTSQNSTKENIIKLREEQFKIQDDREQKLIDEIKETKSNSEELLTKRESLLKNEAGKDEISSLLYTTTIQQNMSYFSQLQNELASLKANKENTLADIKNLNNSINENKITISNLNIAKNIIHNILVIQEPLVSLSPIGPSKRGNIAIAGIASLMFGLFLVFFIEYWKNYISPGINKPKNTPV